MFVCHYPKSYLVLRFGSRLMVGFFFVLIILYSLYLEYDRPLITSASGLAG